MKNTKAIFFDVDSTIYSHRIHDFPTSTKETLQTLKANGYKIGIATSRCRYEMKNLPSFFHEFDFDGAIYDGGALVMEHGQVIAKSLIHEEQTAKLINYAKQEKFPVRYSTFDNDCIIEKCSPRIKDEFFKLYLNMPIIKDYEGEEVFNLLAYPTSHAQQLQVETLLDQCSIVHHAATLEITAKGIDKSIGVKTLTNKWGIDMSEVICFGDGANDVIMLQEAGLGIALGNANEKAKKAADRVCGHIDEDGVYLICKELNLL